jgi:hypothetical protein
MNELLTTMAHDMQIESFRGETEGSYAYRLCYSALGQWCLRVAQNSTDGVMGTSKKNQTIVLSELLHRYTGLFPKTLSYFEGENNGQCNIPVQIRRVYEETGYLVTTEENRNTLADFARSIKVGNSWLYFGLPESEYSVNGLGVYSAPSEYTCQLRDFLIRDLLTPEEFFSAKYSIIDFSEREIQIQECEFFNPLSNKSPSQSWEKGTTVDCTLARISELGPYYLVMRESSDSLLYAHINKEPSSDDFLSCDYRRLYFALKAHYGNPLKAVINALDENYSELALGGYLPNRELYFLLLVAWPARNAVDKVRFILRNDLVSIVSDALRGIGIDMA